MHWADEGAGRARYRCNAEGCGLDLVEHWGTPAPRAFPRNRRDGGAQDEAAVRHGLIPLICVGETLRIEQRPARDILASQVVARLRTGWRSESAAILLAYDPCGAIGVRGSRNQRVR